MLEKIAKTMWCPMVRQMEVSDTGAGQALAGVNADCRQSYTCIASSCMMWRWSESAWNEEGQGFCGLAGKPTIHVKEK